MKTVWTRILAALLFILFFNGQPYIPSLHISEDGLKGPVKMIQEKVRVFSSEYIALKKYNRNGFLTRIDFFGDAPFLGATHSAEEENSINTLDTAGLTKQFTYEFKYLTLNSGTRLQELKQTFYADSTVELTQRFFNDQDSLIKEVAESYKNGIILKSELTLHDFKFFPDSIIKITNEDGHINEKTIFHLDQNKRTIKTISTFYNNSSFSKTISKTYFENYHDRPNLVQIENDDERTVFEYLLDEKGKLSAMHSIRFNYADKTEQRINKNFFVNNITGDSICSSLSIENNKIEIFEEERFKNGQLESWKITELFHKENEETKAYHTVGGFQYQIDTFGNWIELIAFRDDKIDLITTRIIFYF